MQRRVVRFAIAKSGAGCFRAHIVRAESPVTRPLPTRSRPTRSWPLLSATLAAILVLFGGLFGDGQARVAAHEAAVTVLELVLTARNSHVSTPSFEPAFHPSAAIPGEAESASSEADPSDDGGQSAVDQVGSACVILSQASLWRRATRAPACTEPKQSRARPLGLRFSLATRPTRGPPA